MSSKVRAASHAGSWYSDDGEELSSQLDEWLSAAGAPSHAPARAIIAPHAGFSYSGPTSAFAYRQVDNSKLKRVFILGPSHHVHLRGCALTALDRYQTPLGDLVVDADMVAELKATGKFEVMSKKVDEDEHSIEMHLPYVYKVLGGKAVPIVPVLVGSLSRENEALYGDIFRKYLEDETNLFVISSDFCHWGKRFQFTYYDKRDGPIHASIEKLDREGMRLIEAKDPEGFAQYLDDFENTICGRKPIAILLNAVAGLKQTSSIKFIRYAQSSQCVKASDSSVSYASASLVIEDEGGSE